MKTIGLVLETARLRLRELIDADLDFVAGMLGDPEVARYYEKTFTRDDAWDWLRRQQARYARDGHGLWLAVERETEAPVGQVGLVLQEVEGQMLPEIGWLLDRPFWGHGYASEAAAATREAAFGRWRYPAVISLIRPVNERSRRVAERIGMKPGRLVAFHGYEHIVYGAAAP
ncbi:MAG TPA: GNAT family N-acetyltransferase [Vicinamibacteria bacterium]|nr:GNAT family N-acetyltransferase [Vicinamibacteria bacterium]